MSKILKVTIFLSTLLLFVLSPRVTLAATYDLPFSTYYGGGTYEHARDIFVDSQGNMYVVGGTNSSNFPITTGPGFNTGNCQVVGSAGSMDAFIIKFDSTGRRLWARLIGGPCYDRAYGVEVDNQGYVYIAGRAGPGFPVTQGAFQSTFQGTDNGIYVRENAFIAKIRPDGSVVEWASYVGVGQLARDIALDSNNDIYVPLGYSGSGGTPPSSWFINAYQKTLKGGRESGVVKVRSDGTAVLWGTWLGGSGHDTQEASVRVDSNKNVYIIFSTLSSGIPTTTGVYDSSHNGGQDNFIAKLSPDGANLLFGTYYGGSGDEWMSTHNLALDSSGNVYISTWTDSTNITTTSGAFQRSYGGGASDMAIAKFSPTGALLNSTYLGGNGNENPDGFQVSSNGSIFITGMSGSTNFPVPTSSDSYQRTKSGGADAVVVQLSNSLNSVTFSSFLGSGADDNGRSGFIDGQGNMYVVGESAGTGYPVFGTAGSYQSNFNGGSQDIIISKLVASMTTPTATPRPTAIVTNTPIPSATNTPTPTPAVKRGDANGDGAVNELDYDIWLAHYLDPTLSVPGENPDFNDDGKYDGIDYAIWLNNYGL